MTKEAILNAIDRVFFQVREEAITDVADIEQMLIEEIEEEYEYQQDW